MRETRCKERRGFRDGWWRRVSSSMRSTAGRGGKRSHGEKRIDARLERSCGALHAEGVNVETFSPSRELRGSDSARLRRPRAGERQREMQSTPFLLDKQAKRSSECGLDGARTGDHGPGARRCVTAARCLGFRRRALGHASLGDAADDLPTPTGWASPPAADEARSAVGELAGPPSGGGSGAWRGRRHHACRRPGGRGRDLSRARGVWVPLRRCRGARDGHTRRRPVRGNRSGRRLHERKRSLPLACCRSRGVGPQWRSGIGVVEESDPAREWGRSVARAPGAKASVSAWRRRD